MRPPNPSGALALLPVLGLLLLPGSNDHNPELRPGRAERADQSIAVSTARTPSVAPAPRTGSRHLRDAGRDARAELTSLGVASVFPLAMRRAGVCDRHPESGPSSFAPGARPPRGPPCVRPALG